MNLEWLAIGFLAAVVVMLVVHAWQDHGVAARVDRLKALGNGQVPAVAAAAWKSLGA